MKFETGDRAAGREQPGVTGGTGQAGPTRDEDLQGRPRESERRGVAAKR